MGAWNKWNLLFIWNFILLLLLLPLLQAIGVAVLLGLLWWRSKTQTNADIQDQASGKKKEKRSSWSNLTIRFLENLLTSNLLIFPCIEIWIYYRVNFNCSAVCKMLQHPTQLHIVRMRSVKFSPCLFCYFLLSKDILSCPQNQMKNLSTKPMPILLLSFLKRYYCLVPNVRWWIYLLNPCLLHHVLLLLQQPIYIKKLSVFCSWVLFSTSVFSGQLFQCGQLWWHFHWSVNIWQRKEQLICIDWVLTTWVVRCAIAWLS